VQNNKSMRKVKPVQNNNSFRLQNNNNNNTYGQFNNTYSQNNNTYQNNYGQLNNSYQNYNQNNGNFNYQNTPYQPIVENGLQSQNLSQSQSLNNLSQSQPYIPFGQQNNNTYGQYNNNSFQNNGTFGQTSGFVGNNGFQNTFQPQNEFGYQSQNLSQSQSFNNLTQGQPFNNLTQGQPFNNPPQGQPFNNPPKYSLNIHRGFEIYGKRNDDTRSFDHLSYIPTNTPFPIRQIKLYGNQYVQGLQVSYELNGLTPLEIGYTNNYPYEQVLNFETGEVIIEVCGRYGDFIDQLDIKTNLGHTIRVGGNGGTPFRYSIPQSSQIVGFYGGVGSCLHNIGIYYA